MKVLITGNSGFVGTVVEQTLKRHDIETIGYDIKEGFDICNYEQLKLRAIGCSVIIHLAAIDNDNPVEIVENNITGTMNVLNIYREMNIEKLIFMSSVDSTGVFQGEDKPKYLPIDDEYPCHPHKPYSLSKYENEKMCKYYQNLCNRAILCIRAPGIWNEDTYKEIINNRMKRLSYEWDPYWEYGAFIDIRDLAEAVYKAVRLDFHGYHCYFISSDDITTSGKTSKELVDFLFPQIEWKGDEIYVRNPYRTLIKNDRIKDFLGWEPKYSWNNQVPKFA